MYCALLHLGNVRIKNYRRAFVSSINYIVSLFQTTYYPRELFLRKVGVLSTGICMLNCEKNKRQIPVRTSRGLNLVNQPFKLEENK